MSTAYATAAELAVALNIRNTPTQAQIDRMEEVLLAAAGEIDSEIGLLEDGAVALSGAWKLALASQVNIERAVEHWHARPVGFGIVGLDSESPIRLARDTWERHAHKLAPLKTSYGFA